MDDRDDALIWYGFYLFSSLFYLFCMLQSIVWLNRIQSHIHSSANIITNPGSRACTCRISILGSMKIETCWVESNTRSKDLLWLKLMIHSKPAVAMSETEKESNNQRNLGWFSVKIKAMWKFVLVICHWKKICRQEQKQMIVRF